MSGWAGRWWAGGWSELKIWRKNSLLARVERVNESCVGECVWERESVSLRENSVDLLEKTKTGSQRYSRC